jgi:NAD(P)-dependent dehydrogenase (short-subunit alcohol dehydrogenase family)
MTEHDWDQVLDVNLKGSCFCAQQVAKAMVSAGRQGSIINIASGAALRGSPSGVHYVASKGGVLSLTRAMALELAPYRIRVNAIAPGLTDTAQPRYGSSEAEIAEMARAIPLGRMAQPDGIARAAVFLASDKCRLCHGSDPARKRRFLSGVRWDGHPQQTRKDLEIRGSDSPPSPRLSPG